MNLRINYKAEINGFINGLSPKKVISAQELRNEENTNAQRVQLIRDMNQNLENETDVNEAKQQRESKSDEESDAASIHVYNNSVVYTSIQESTQYTVQN